MRAQRAQGHEGMARPANGSPQQGGDRGRPEAAQPEVLGVPQGRNRRRRPATTGAGDGDFFPHRITGRGVGGVLVADQVNGSGPDKNRNRIRILI
jgi:hypothetical protein